ncbi:MAG: aminotransferase class V-fold PLP-dependent enzyme [Oscillospiraceae bacterium]|nr:aminotransferase class V-fold PLP-dependent enzyme [Oscillospiraceae bacterium]
MIYLDNAATTNPKPESVRRAVSQTLLRFSVNSGRGSYSTAVSAAELIYSVREKAAAFFGEQNPERVIFTPNCTASLNYVLKGLLKPGDHCIVSSLEHNAVMRPLYALTKKGVTYSVAEADFYDDAVTVNHFRQLIQPETRLIVCAHASNLLGLCLPVEAIGGLCREHGITFAVDAAQTAGILPLDVEKMNIDFLCVAPHKGLYAPMGTGILIARQSLDTILEGGTGTSSYCLEQPSDPPERFESGTQNLPGIAGVGAGLDFVTAKTPERIYTHELGLVTALYRRLANTPGVRLYTECPKMWHYAPVLAFNIGDMESSEVGEALNKAGFAVRTGLHCAPTAHRLIGTLRQGAVRVCPSAFTRQEDMSGFARTVAWIALTVRKPR